MRISEPAIPVLRSRRVRALVAAGLLSGCAVGPDYVRPDIATGERFEHQAAAERREGAATAELTRWWDGFGDPQLVRYVMVAQQQNLDLAIALARVAQAGAMVGATTAALLPAGNVSGQAARAYQSVETLLGRVLESAPGFDRYGHAYEANLGASWELDAFGGRRREREAALAEYQASEAGAVATRLAVSAQTAETYIAIRGLQTRLKITRQQVQTHQDLLSTITLLQGKGLVADRDVWQAEGALAQVRAAVPVLESGLEVTSNALDVLLGSPPGTHRAELIEARPVPVPPSIASIGVPADLLQRRPDLILAERRLAASNARIGVSLAEFYPRFSLSGMLGSAAMSGGDLVSSGASQSAGVLGLRWRLFDFGRINAQIAAARGAEAENLAAYRLTALHATEDVENALSVLLRREEQAALLTKAVDSLGRARSASAAAYEKGVVSLIEVLQADDSLLRASDAQAQALTESARAAVATFRALGGGWDAPTSIAGQ